MKHEQFSEVIKEAARWYLEPEGPVEMPAVALLCRRFGLTALQACETIAVAQKYRLSQRAAG